MEKLAIKIPVLIFFLAVIYFASTGFETVDAIVRAFLIAFGMALIILILTMILMFFLTLREGKSESVKTLGVKDAGKKVEMQA
jgi:hypothetical protein